MHIIIFGDSEAYGAFDREGGWAARLRKHEDEKSSYCQDYYCLVYNMSISGDTSAGVLERFDAEARIRLDDDKNNVFMISIGINDSMVLHGKKDNQVPLKNFKQNIQKIIEKSRKYSNKIAFLGLLSVDESKMDPIPWHSGSYKNPDVKKFNEAVKEVCRKNKVPFIDFFDAWIKEDYKSLLLDGVHPNTKGHEMLFSAVRSFLEKEKII